METKSKVQHDKSLKKMSQARRGSNKYKKFVGNLAEGIQVNSERIRVNTTRFQNSSVPNGDVPIYGGPTGFRGAKITISVNANLN